MVDQTFIETDNSLQLLNEVIVMAGGGIIMYNLILNWNPFNYYDKTHEPWHTWSPYHTFHGMHVLLLYDSSYYNTGLAKAITVYYYGPSCLFQTTWHGC